ncbi:MAG TPA: exonuclease domain-containing protein [archaeon]|nr:exonuclease domain-containing protein [archaeon]
MTDVPKLSALERAFEVLREEPLSGMEICRRMLAIENLSPELAGRLACTLLGSDPRFRELGDGTWTVSCGDAALLAMDLERATFVVVDVETTGFRPPADRVIELGMVKVDGCRVVDEYEALINPRRPIPGPIASLTGITWGMVAQCPVFEEVCEPFLEFLGDAVFVAHNASFDWRFIQSELALAGGRTLLNRKLCTKILARRLLPELDRRSLDELARFFNFQFSARHRALGDARVTASVLLRFIERAVEREITTLSGLFDFIKPRGTGRT